MIFERSIFILSLIATAAYLAAGVYAYVAPPEADMATHVLVTVAATLLLLLPHVWTLFYLWGTGRAVRKEVEAKRASPRVMSEARRYRRRAVPPLLLASACALAALAMGNLGYSPTLSWLHPTLFFAALAFQVWALWAQRRSLWDNAEMLDELDRRARAAQSPAPAA